jgi:DNA-directed RNA polymerase subunit K/omega
MSDLELNDDDDDDLDEDPIINNIEFIDDKDTFDTSTHFTQSILTRYEKTMVIIERTEQLASGSIPLINNADSFNSIDEVVLEELKQKKIPFIIKRSIGSKIDYYKLSDLKIL